MNHSPKMRFERQTLLLNYHQNLKMSIYAKWKAETLNHDQQHILLPVQQLQNRVEKGLFIYRNDLENSKAALTVRLQLPSGVTASTHNILVDITDCQ